MNSLAAFSPHGCNQDFLTCIANLSNDGVFTPPEFVGLSPGGNGDHPPVVLVMTDLI